MKKVIILFALMLTGCVEAKEEIVCNPTIEYVEVIKYVEIDNIIIETEYIEVIEFVEVMETVIEFVEVIVEVEVEKIVYKTNTVEKIVEVFVEVPIETIIYEQIYETDIISFIGDSITMGFDIPNYTRRTTEIINHGISGDTTRNMVLRQHLYISYNPNIIFIMAGINDINRDYETEELLSNYDILVNRFLEELPNAEIYLQSILPIGEIVTTINSGIIPIANDYLLNIANNNDSVEYIDLNSLFSLESGYMNPLYTIDGVHLNEVGYSVWIEELKKYNIG